MSDTTNANIEDYDDYSDEEMSDVEYPHNPQLSAGGAWWDLNDGEEEEGNYYYWDEGHAIKEREYMQLIQDLYRPDRYIEWPPQDEGSEPINLEKEYAVDDHWEIEAEEKFLIATSDNITKGNGWYENEEFEVYLVV